MYKGISLGLTGMWSVALLLTFMGQLGFSPLALTLSTLVLGFSTYLTSQLCALLFGVKSHGESSFITALILVFLFTPTTDPAQLVVLGFVGMIAGASKFIVTWRGRHIFNPAALAAAVITIAGLGSASWWVATPYMTPVVLAVAAVSLYQSKRFLVVGVFLAITIPALVIQFLAFGATVTESLWLLMSWPILFLATIMLTEPLTLPPRKWQMYIVAAVVAVAFLLPIQVGSIQMTPALALIIGNIIAAIFAARYAVTLTFKKRRPLTATTDELVFTPSAPLAFEPGQFAELTLFHKRPDFRGVRRSFSITSLPEANEVSFGIKYYQPSSTYKKTLRQFSKGDALRISNLGGDFVLPKQQDRPLLFVAGGIGVTPFISHIRSLQKSKEVRDIVLVYAVSSPEEIAYEEELVASGISVIIVTAVKPKNLPKIWRYLKGSRIDFGELTALIPDIADREAYVSGPTSFVQGGKSSLRKLGVRSVKSDYFAGY